MPSKGNPVVKTRVTTELEREVEVTINRRNLHSDNEPWDVSEFIRSAIREKIAHMERSRNKGRKRTDKKEKTARTQQTVKQDALTEAKSIREAICRCRADLLELLALTDYVDSMQEINRALHNLQCQESWLPEMERGIESIVVENDGQEQDRDNGKG